LKSLSLIAVLAVLSLVMGCGDASLPHLTSIDVSPANPSVPSGQPQQFTATGTFSDNSTRDLTGLVTWASSDLSVSSIAADGLATTLTPGTSTISASFDTTTGTVSGSTLLTVIEPTLTAVVIIDGTSVIPGPNSVASAKIAKGTTHQFFAYGIYSDGSERNITGIVTWSSSPLSVATITNAGRATGVSAGTATITATDSTTSLAGTTTLDVTGATLDTVVVSPTTQTIAPLTRLRFAALGEFSDGTSQDITEDANWTSSSAAIAIVSNSTPKGIATAVAAGAATIKAALGATQGSAPLTVSSASLTSIALTPSTSGVAIGSTLLLQAVGTFSDTTTQPLNLAAAWTVSPSDGSIATVDQTGLVTGVATGTATVTAKVGAVTKTATLNVQDLTSLAITPAAPTIAQGSQTQLVATATLADGTTQDVSSSVNWVSTSPTIATVNDALNSSGWATGIAPGTTTIDATLNGQVASAPLTVTNATLSTVAVTPATAQNIALGKGQQYQATGTFSDSSTQDLSNQVSWSSSDPAVAVINGSGLATSTGVGTTTIKATGNINGTMASDQKVLTVH